MKALNFVVRFLSFLLLFSLHRAVANSVTPEEARQLRDEVREMFYHAFDGYMEHAFPLDELRPLSCEGEDTLGGYALTLIDSLDTLALFGDREHFTASVEWIGKNLRFDINKTVSIFETTIRILGGLLSAHLIASDYATGMRVPSYDNQLLDLAEDLARRLLPAFDTPTDNIYSWWWDLTIEFGVLSRLTNDPIFEQVTKNAVRGLWARRSKLNLVGAHINVFTGEWTQKTLNRKTHNYELAPVETQLQLYYSINLPLDPSLFFLWTSIDSFYEYLLKVCRGQYGFAAIVWPLFNSLQAFWPGLQVLAGDIDPAIRTHTAFFSVWKRYGFTPEGFNLATLSVQHGQKSYPLRPELIESTYWLYKATRDPRYLDVGRDIIASLQYGARCPCGYCHISDVENHKREDHMESFFLAETVHFSTEGHLLPATPQISLLQEHCSYFGAYCNRGYLKEESRASDKSADFQETNGSRASEGWVRTAFPLDSSSFEASPLSGKLMFSSHSWKFSSFTQGLCPGLTHAQKYGISYLALVDTLNEDNSAKQKDTVVQSHAIVVVSDQIANQSLSGDSYNVKESTGKEPESDPSQS
ncbi:putative alpha-mannosidase I MNS4 [Hibiscus syriacus]|uniref:alpha-1,2-Mannosidase n=1 Tax=Hibiscus syriacus TaxID=106335 RepID=A0A6A2YC31_HIBSY|nr:putative alpha-mannosidase I MNS4 [Hibiscus syriacus]